MSKSSAILRRTASLFVFALTVLVFAQACASSQAVPTSQLTSTASELIQTSALTPTEAPTPDGRRYQPVREPGEWLLSARPIWFYHPER
jgi:hypothetical protein